MTLPYHKPYLYGKKATINVSLQATLSSSCTDSIGMFGSCNAEGPILERDF